MFVAKSLTVQICSFSSSFVYVMTMAEIHSDDHRLRYRRTQSTTRAEEITNHEQKERQSQPDKP